MIDENDVRQLKHGWTTMLRLLSAYLIIQREQMTEEVQQEVRSFISVCPEQNLCFLKVSRLEKFERTSW